MPFSRKVQEVKMVEKQRSINMQDSKYHLTPALSSSLTLDDPLELDLRFEREAQKRKTNAMKPCTGIVLLNFVQQMMAH
jgi:hypothetical protein